MKPAADPPAVEACSSGGGATGAGASPPCSRAIFNNGERHMSDNTITITLDDLTGPDGLDGAYQSMVNRLADIAVSKMSGGHAQSFHAACVEAINAAVTGKIAARIEELMSKPIPTTDRFGNVQGEPTTFDQMIAEAVEGALTKKVDIYGKPRIGRGESGDKTLFQYALSEVATAGLRTEVFKAVKQVNADAKAAVSQEVAKQIQAALK